MTIDEAIKELQKGLIDGLDDPEDSIGGAIKLGIEALKEIKYLQRMDADFKDYILPGETK